MIRTLRLALAGGAGTVLALADLPAQSAAAADSLIGIWASETTFGPALSGELTVRREGSSWRATLSSFDTRFPVAADSVRFTLPGNIGGFRGALTDRGRAIAGFWLQPSGETEDRRDPGGSGQPFATPLELKRVTRDVWRGTVRPLRDRFTLYLRIFPNPEGVLVGAFRNPELNSNGGASHFRVSREGDSVRFSVRPDTTRAPETRHTAALTSPDQLRILWPDLGRGVELRRRTSVEAAGFFPRSPDQPAYVYRRPPVTGDGWETARARDVGMDEAALAHLIQKLIDADPAARRPALIHSLLVARRGKLVLDEYFFGFDRDRTHDMRSAGKTFASVMLGSAMLGGAKLTPETPIYDLVAGRGPFANPDPRKPQITLAHLMTHTSGLACDDNDDASPGNEGTMQTQRRQPDWWKYTLDLPMVHDPGRRYAYCSANSNLMGAALTVGTGTWLPELFQRTIAGPLQFGLYHWNLMPTGHGYLGGGAFVRPRDLLKVGQTYLDGGLWQGRRIVDSSWVTRSTAPHAEITEASTGLDAENFPNFYSESVDGYAWHINPLSSAGRSYRAYAATGNGGQILMVVPELDLTVVFTGGNYMQGGIWGRWGQEIVGGEIIRAIRP